MAAIEAVALVPILLLVVTFVLQGAVAIWTTTATDTSVRHAARADSLGRDPGTAADQALPSGLKVEKIERFGPGHGVRLAVAVPRVSPLPQFTVSRSVILP